MNKVKAVIIDLDGTLCNVDHRLHHIKGEKKDWPAFFSEVSGDSINIWCATLVESMHQAGWRIVFCTGREGTDKIKTDTIVWLNTIFNIEYDLYHRKEGDHRKDAIIKEEIFREKIEPHYDVLFAVDDRQQVVDMWRKVGVTCLQCAKGDF